MVKIMENPIKTGDLGENPPFKETPIYGYVNICNMLAFCVFFKENHSNKGVF